MKLKYIFLGIAGLLLLTKSSNNNSNLYDYNNTEKTYSFKKKTYNLTEFKNLKEYGYENYLIPCDQHMELIANKISKEYPELSVDCCFGETIPTILVSMYVNKPVKLYPMFNENNEDQFPNDDWEEYMLSVSFEIFFDESSLKIKISESSSEYWDEIDMDFLPVEDTEDNIDGQIKFVLGVLDYWKTTSSKNVEANF